MNVSALSWSLGLYIISAFSSILTLICLFSLIKIVYLLIQIFMYE
jgi:hypothetical protein